jgi:hypothetical protein
VAGIGGLATPKEQGRRDPHRADLDVRRLLENSALSFDSATVRQTQVWGEALQRSVASWRHRQARRQEVVR